MGGPMQPPRMAAFLGGRMGPSGYPVAASPPGPLSKKFPPS